MGIDPLIQMKNSWKKKKGFTTERDRFQFCVDVVVRGFFLCSLLAMNDEHLRTLCILIIIKSILFPLPRIVLSNFEMGRLYFSSNPNMLNKCLIIRKSKAILAGVLCPFSTANRCLHGLFGAWQRLGKRVEVESIMRTQHNCLIYTY